MSSEKKQLGFYAYDVAPGQQMLPMIAQASRERGYEPVMPEAQKRGEARKYLERFRECHAVILGLSSEATKEEVEIAEALLHEQVPIVVVADTYRSLERPLARDIAPDVAAAFVALPGDVRSARDFGYANAQYVGSPPHWYEKYQQVLEGRKKRPTLQKIRHHPSKGTQTEPLTEEDTLFYVEGFKHWPKRVTIILQRVQEAARALCKSPVLHFREHPGEKTAKHLDGTAYAVEIWKRRDILNREWRLLDDLSSEQSIGAADGSFLSAGATGSIAGAQAEANMANIFDPTLKKRIGTNEWFVAAAGAMHHVQILSDIHDAMQVMLNPQALEFLHARQEFAFPAPKKGERTEMKILEAMERVLNMNA